MNFFLGILTSISKKSKAYKNETEYMDLYALCQEIKIIDKFSINKMIVYKNALVNKICEIDEIQLLELCRDNRHCGNEIALRVLAKEAIKRNIAFKDKKGVHFYMKGEEYCKLAKINTVYKKLILG